VAKATSVDSLLDKYKGFVVPSPALGRPSSVDSALGVESADETPAAAEAAGAAAQRAAGASTRKDSGVGEDDDEDECASHANDNDEEDEEEAMRDLCMRVCEAVISGWASSQNSSTLLHSRSIESGLIGCSSRVDLVDVPVVDRGSRCYRSLL